MGGMREVSIISHRPVTRSDLKQERSFFRGSVSSFLQLVVLVLHTPIAVVKRGAFLAPKEVVIKNSISFS